MVRQEKYPEPDPTGRPRREFYQILDREMGETRPCIVAFPKNGSHAVVHTAEDCERWIKCRNEKQFKGDVRPRLAEWDAPAPIKKMVDQALNGEYDDLAESNGYESVLSFVMSIAEDAQRPADEMQKKRLRERTTK